MLITCRLTVVTCVGWICGTTVGIILVLTICRVGDTRGGSYCAGNMFGGQHIGILQW
ncbi:hypothetical protein RST01_17820 [Rummeliibacillus stabekisii]|nr:hypothetical protein RST01_17820 [Rummeliibacillus stabekisii]